MDGELRAAEEKLKREHKEMKEAARARIEREKKILANVQAARNQQLAARNASALRPQQKPDGQPAPRFLLSKMKSGKGMKVPVRVRIEREILVMIIVAAQLAARNAAALRPQEKPGDQRASRFFPSKMKSGEGMKVMVRARIEREMLFMIIVAAQFAARNAAALMTQERRHRELKAREEKDGALDDPGNHEDGDGKDEGLLGQSKPNVYVDTARTSKPVLHLDLDAARTSKPALRLPESVIEDTTRRMNKRSYYDGDDGSIKDVKKIRNQSQAGSRGTYADHEEKSEEEETETDDQVKTEPDDGDDQQE